jgi:ABC-type nitrate/sulfonate/bicarbonate transport system substrate-binding protein
VQATPLNPPRTVRIANAGLAAQGPTYLAIERGYLKELGLEPEIVELTSTNDMVPLLNSGQLDVGFQAINPAAFNAAARGVGVRMVADHGSNLPGRSTPSLAIRTDVLEQHPWTGSYAILKGMKMAVSSLGTLSERQVELMLRRAGLQLTDIDIVPLPFPDMAVAFSNKAIDAGVFNEPWATQLEQQGVIKKVVYTDDIDPNGPVAGVLFGESFAQNTPAARNYLVAYLKGVRDYWDAYDGRLDFQIVVDVLKKHTPVKDEALIRKIPPTGQNPAGYFELQKLAEVQDWFVAKSLVTQHVELDKVVDHSFADYANSVLGPYTPVENPRRPS